jgi:hypothetical protein
MDKVKSARISLLCLLTVFFFAVPQVAVAQTPPDIYIDKDSGTYGDAFTATLTAADNTGTTYVWLLSGGVLPNGLKLDDIQTGSTTTISGDTLKEAGNITFKIKVSIDDVDKEEEFTIKIGKAELTITADNKDTIYGEPAPVFTMIPSGLKRDENFDAAVLGTLSYTTNYENTSNSSNNGVGTYFINPDTSSLTSSNYKFSVVRGTLTVGKATLNVKADDAFITYGEAFSTVYNSLNELVITQTDFKYDDDSKNIDDIITITNSGDIFSSSYAPNSDVSEQYDVNVNTSNLFAYNYIFTNLSKGKLTVNIREVDKPTLAGSAPLTYTGSEISVNLNPSSLYYDITPTGTTDKATDEGTYTVIVGLTCGPNTNTNCKWANNETNPLSLTWTISPAEIQTVHIGLTTPVTGSDVLDKNDATTPTTFYTVSQLAWYDEFGSQMTVGDKFAALSTYTVKITVERGSTNYKLTDSTNASINSSGSGVSRSASSDGVSLYFEYTFPRTDSESSDSSPPAVSSSSSGSLPPVVSSSSSDSSPPVVSSSSAGSSSSTGSSSSGSSSSSDSSSSGASSSSSETEIVDVDIVIDPPMNGGTPVKTIDSPEFTASVSWSPNHDPFKELQVYTATVKITAKPGYKFELEPMATINGDDVVSTLNSDGTVTLPPYPFPKTLATPSTVVSDIKVIKQPIKIAYSHGEQLDLSGIVVEFTYDDNRTEEIMLRDFATKRITTNPINGTMLSSSMHNNARVEVTYTYNKTNLRAYTDALIVIKKAIPTIAIAGKTLEVDPNDSKKFIYVSKCADKDVDVKISQDDAEIVVAGQLGMGLGEYRLTTELDYGDNPFKITVHPDNGPREEYTLTVKSPFPAEQMIKVRWGNTLTVIDNSRTPYDFANYKWYRNGKEIGSGRSWSAGDNGEKLSSKDNYYVEATTEEGKSIRSCEVKIPGAAKQEYGILLKNNPAYSNVGINVSAPEEISEMEIAVYNIAGKQIYKQKGSHNFNWNLTDAMHRNVSNGMYIVIAKAKGESGMLYRYSAKFVVKR